MFIRKIEEIERENLFHFVVALDSKSGCSLRCSGFQCNNIKQFATVIAIQKVTWNVRKVLI